MKTFFTIVGTHSDNAPPAMFNVPIGGGSDNAEETIEDTLLLPVKQNQEM